MVFMKETPSRRIRVTLWAMYVVSVLWIGWSAWWLWQGSDYRYLYSAVGLVNALLIGTLAYFLGRGRRWAWWGALVVAGFNVITTITDQVGWFDLVYLVPAVGVFLMVVVLKFPRSSGSSERLDIVDEHDHVIGQGDRHAIHMNAELHREVGVFIYNAKGDILLQRRAPDKDIAPGKLDTSVGGHVSAGQTYLGAAIMEMEEETGIRVQPEDLFFMYKNKRQSNQQKNGMINYAFRCMYLYRFREGTDTLRLEDGKATCLEWWPMEKLRGLREEDKAQFTSFVYKDLPQVLAAVEKEMAKERRQI